MLAVCSGCGFIFNAAWDPERTVYSDQYEETQGFSPTFNTFNRAIAEELVSSYDIRGKTVLEIGCGKGEFLSLICKLGGNRGIGYDPSFVPARQRSEQNIRFVREFFTEDTNEVAPDLLCCKMTLEHIGQTHRFLTCCPRGREPQGFGRLFPGARCRPHPERGRVLGCLLRALFVFQRHVA